MATEALELEQSGLSYQRVPPGYRFPYGHTHEKQEEVYVVLRGNGRMKLDDEIVELKEWDAVRVPPGTWRGYEAGPEGLEIIVIGAPSLGEAPPRRRRGPTRLVGGLAPLVPAGAGARRADSRSLIKVVRSVGGLADERYDVRGLVESLRRHLGETRLAGASCRLLTSRPDVLRRLFDDPMRVHACDLRPASSPPKSA